MTVGWKIAVNLYLKLNMVKAYWSDENGETSNLMSMFPRISWAQYLRPRKTDSYDIVNMLFEAGDGRGMILISGQDQFNIIKLKVSVSDTISIKIGD